MHETFADNITGSCNNIREHEGFIIDRKQKSRYDNHETVWNYVIAIEYWQTY